jgi:hypothetical protein
MCIFKSQYFGKCVEVKRLVNNEKARKFFEEADRLDCPTNWLCWVEGECGC